MNSPIVIYNSKPIEGVLCFGGSHPTPLLDMPWPRKMIDHAWNWAELNGKLRHNDVHGEEEAKLVLDETFMFSNKRGQGVTQEKAMVVEDLCLVMLWILML